MFFTLLSKSTLQTCYRLWCFGKIGAFVYKWNGWIWDTTNELYGILWIL